jgi:hypothetical protein
MLGLVKLRSVERRWLRWGTLDNVEFLKTDDVFQKSVFESYTHVEVKTCTQLL